MTFKEKIDNILSANNLGIDSPSGLEEKLGIGQGSISKSYYNKKEDESPGRATIKKIIEGMGINRKWWDTGEGDIFLTSTGLVKSSGEVKETFYKNLIEGNEEYSLIPRAVLKDYKIVPDKIIDVIIDSNRNEKQAITQSFQDQKDILINKHESIITGYEAKIKRLEAEIKELEIEREKLENERENLKRQVTLKLK